MLVKGYLASCGVDTNVSEEDIVRGIEKVFGFNVQGPRNPDEE